MNNISSNIRKIRELKNFTQAYVSEKLGMSISGYGQIERGNSEITLSRLQEVAQILETSLEEILFFDAHRLISSNGTASSNLNRAYLAQKEFSDQSILMTYYHYLQMENEFLKATFQQLLLKKKTKKNEHE